MGAKIVEYSLVVTALLVQFSVVIAQEYPCYEINQQMLLGLFEAALTGDSDTLWELQQIYFNPDSNQSPGQVCLSVTIHVDTIANPHCPCMYQNGPAFDGFPDNWYFDSYYELQLHVADDVSDTSELANLMTKSGIIVVFYVFDPPFYSIMKTLSSSIALSLPYTSQYSEDSGYYAPIDINISTKLNEMPCLDDAVYALRSVLMWVSFNNINFDTMSIIIIIFIRPNPMQELTSMELNRVKKKQIGVQS